MTAQRSKSKYFSRRQKPSKMLKNKIQLSRSGDLIDFIKRFTNQGNIPSESTSRDCTKWKVFTGRRVKQGYY